MTVTSNRFSTQDEDLTRREIVTPEGVPLVFYIARAGDRMAAFLLDILLMLVMLAAMFLLAFLFSDFLGGINAGAVGLLGLFVIRNGYFLWFETRWQGRTPGKRRLGIRVIDAHGRMLRMDQLIVRNLTREAEWFYPLVALFQPTVIDTAGPGVVRVASVLWFGIFLLLPLFNRERRRIGDLLAGTMVVQENRAALRTDLGRKSPGARTIAPEFSPEQLEKYGVYELQVLEQVLREQANDKRAIRVVAEKIARKIGWTQKIKRPYDFLTGFYEAQRARLEHDLLLGQARETKHDSSGRELAEGEDRHG